MAIYNNDGFQETITGIDNNDGFQETITGKGTAQDTNIANFSFT